MAEPHKDYSGTPLWRKLGIRQDARVLLVGAPHGFEDLLEPLPEGAAVLARAGRNLDIVVMFATAQAHLASGFAATKPRLRYNGRLWIAWPKKASNVPSDITFESAQALGLRAGLVDNKTASLTEVYQGMQLVYRLKDRPSGWKTAERRSSGGTGSF